MVVTKTEPIEPFWISANGVFKHIRCSTIGSEIDGALPVNKKNVRQTVPGVMYKMNKQKTEIENDLYENMNKTKKQKRNC